MLNEIIGAFDAYHRFKMQKMLYSILIPVIILIGLLVFTAIRKTDKIRLRNQDQKISSLSIENRALKSGREKDNYQIDSLNEGLAEATNQVEQMKSRITTLKKDSLEKGEKLYNVSLERNCLSNSLVKTRQDLAYNISYVQDLTHSFKTVYTAAVISPKQFISLQQDTLLDRTLHNLGLGQVMVEKVYDVKSLSGIQKAGNLILLLSFCCAVVLIFRLRRRNQELWRLYLEELQMPRAVNQVQNQV